MAITLTRRSDGTLLNGTTPIVLRGGSYDLFLAPGASPRAIVTGVPIETVEPGYPAGANPCQPAAEKETRARQAVWRDAGNDFAPFFGAMRDNRCNFVRVFLTGGVLLGANGVPASLTPFRREGAAPYRYDVAGAVLRGSWNEEYFTRLAAFVRQADEAGVVVQLTLFNYFDLTDEDPAVPQLLTWRGSFWNPANSLDAAWGRTHLVSPADPTNVSVRQRAFVKPANSLRAVQQELIGKVVKTVAPHANVVLEVANEPRPVGDAAAIADLAAFGSHMTGLIVRYRTSLAAKARISVNASFVPVAPGVVPGESDVLRWKKDGLPHYGAIDVVSYHGLTAQGEAVFPGGGCGGRNVRNKRVDPDAVRARAATHLADHPDKALLYSTDAVLVEQFEHTYRNVLGGTVGMNVRDGQITVSPLDGSLKEQLLHTNVEHWALSVFTEGGGGRLGKLHFHNHSTFFAQLQEIGRAAAARGLAPPIAAAPAAV